MDFNQGVSALPESTNRGKYVSVPSDAACVWLMNEEEFCKWLANGRELE